MSIHGRARVIEVFGDACPVCTHSVKIDHTITPPPADTSGRHAKPDNDNDPDRLQPWQEHMVKQIRQATANPEHVIVTPPYQHPQRQFTTADVAAFAAANAEHSMMRTYTERSQKGLGSHHDSEILAMTFREIIDSNGIGYSARPGIVSETPTRQCVVWYSISKALLDDAPLLAAALQQLDNVAAENLAEVGTVIGDIERSINPRPLIEQHAPWMDCDCCPDAIVIYRATIAG